MITYNEDYCHYLNQLTHIFLVEQGLDYLTRKVRKIPIVAMYCEFIATFRFKLTRTSQNRCQSDSEQNRKGKREICGRATGLTSFDTHP